MIEEKSAQEKLTEIQVRWLEIQIAEYEARHPEIVEARQREIDAAQAIATECAERAKLLAPLGGTSIEIKDAFWIIAISLIVACFFGLALLGR